MHGILEQMTHSRRDEQRADLRENLVRAMQDTSNPKALLEEFESMATEWVPPERTGFEPVAERALA